MRKHIAAALAVLSAFGAAPLLAQTPQTEELVDRVVAVVGDTTLLHSDVVVQLEQLEAAGQTIPTDPAARDALVRQIVQQAIDDLLLVEAARASGITASESDVSGAVDRQMQQVQQQFGSQAEFARALAASGRSVEEYRATLVKQFIDRAMVQRYVAQRSEQMRRPVVTQAQMEEFFRAQAARLGTRPANVSFQQVIVRPTPSDSAMARARRQADSVLAEVRAGGDFAVLARRYSQDGSAQQGGDLGWFREGQMVRPFEAMAFALRPGDVSPVVETEFGYHIIRLEKIRGPERSARHILIRPELTAEDVARARQRADSIAVAIRAGAAIGPIADSTRTPPDQRNNRDVQVDRLPAPYAELARAEANQVIGPIEVPVPGGQTGFAVVRVTGKQPEGAYQLADVEQQVRERLQEQLLAEQIVQELRRTTHIAVRL
jgi:peptidyl-prolyl cis-trans isomerase SurA